MAQFDVFENKNKNTAKQFPFLLEVQSDIFADSNRAIYVPLVLANTLDKPDSTLNAEITLLDKKLRLFPLDIASAPRSVVGKCVGNVKSDSDKVVAAFDLLFARF